MITEQQIRSIAGNGLAGTDKFVTDVVIKPSNRIFVYIDSESFLTIDDCKLLSRFIEAELDRESEDFELSVSSPGADKPLQDPRQFRKHVGRNVEVCTKAGEKITGNLTDVSDETVCLSVKLKPKAVATETIIPFSEIKEIIIIISFK